MFFVRCYRKGSAKSGTTNVAEWDKCPDLNTFYQTCEGNGEGKYLLFDDIFFPFFLNIDLI